ncbi:MAG: TonB-dependent receptor [Acidobacteriota bacterium]
MRYLAALLLCCAAWAQEFRGTILGRVTDPSGAVVPGVAVSAVNEDTNASVSTKTNQEGNYRIPFLLPGNYRLLIEQAGFKKIERRGIRVSVGSDVTLDFLLEVGAPTESVTVTGSAPLVNTSNADLGVVIDNTYIQNLPISLTRNAMNRIMLSAGVTGDTGTYTSNAQSEFSIMGGGSTRGRNEVVVDGIPNTIPQSGGVIVFVPPLDAVEEMKVHTTLFDSAYGHSNGGAVSITTRGGGNEIHGAVYDFERWRNLNANSWRNNRDGIAKPSVSYNQFGGVFSGPVVVPRLYNGRNRTFFSFSLENDLDKRDMSRRARAPTELERNGDFSQTLNRLGRGLLQLYDPWTTTGSGSTAARTPFPGARIPAARLDPTGSVVAKAYPLPNLPDPPQINKYNWAAAGITEVAQSQFSLRGDHTLGARQRLFARYSKLKRRQEGEDLMRGAYSYPAEGTSDLGLDQRYFHSIAVDLTTTFSPTLVGSLRYGLSGRDSPRTVPPELQDPAPLNLHPDILRNQSVRGWPRFNPGENFANFGSTLREERWYTHTAVATFYKSLGNHSLKFGGDYRATRKNTAPSSTANSGDFTFSAVFTQANPFVPTSADTSGSGLASLLLGVPASGNLGYNSPLSLQNHYLAAFVQEEWKVTPKLTLNFGVRYELETPYTERFNRVSYGFHYDAPSPLKAPGLDLRGGLMFAAVGGNPRREGQVDGNNFGPRFGFAYSLSGKTVLRGGYGLFYAAQAFNTDFDGTVATFNAVTPFVGTIDNGATPYNTLANPFPAGLRGPEGSERGLAARYGDSLTLFDVGRVSPYSQQWQFSIQRELPSQIVVEAAYAGMLSLKQLERFELNEKPDRYLALGAAENNRIPNPFLGIFPATSSLGQGATVVQSRLWVRYPQYTSINIEGLNTGRAIYHALQMRAEKRLTRGLNVHWTYTNSKLIDNNTTSVINERHYRTVSEYDVAQVMRLAVVYELPFGPGKALGSTLTGFLARLAEGWSLSAYFNARSGAPLSISHTNGRPVRLRNAARSGDVASRLGERRDPATGKVLNPYFDLDAFAPSPTQYWVSPEPPRLDELRGPAGFGRNLSLTKNVKLWERLKLQLRCEATNFTNSPSWGNPGTDMRNASTFGVIDSGGGGRSVQMSARLTF